MVVRRSVSRRRMLKNAAVAVGGGAAAGLFGGGELAAQAPAIRTGSRAGWRFRAFIENGQFNAKALGPSTFTLDRAKDALQVVSDITTVGAVIMFS